MDGRMHFLIASATIFFFLFMQFWYAKCCFQLFECCHIFEWFIMCIDGIWSWTCSWGLNMSFPQHLLLDSNDYVNIHATVWWSGWFHSAVRVVERRRISVRNSSFAVGSASFFQILFSGPLCFLFGFLWHYSKVASASVPSVLSHYKIQ